MDPEQITHTPIEQYTQIQVQQRQPSSSSSGSTNSGGRPQTQSLSEKPLLGSGSSQEYSPARDPNNLYADVPQVPPTTRSRGHRMRGPSQRTVASDQDPVNPSCLSWIVPFAEKPPVEEEHHVCVAPPFYFASILSLTLLRQTIGYRLNPTILDAVREREKG
jgi:hypothetical protein